MAGFHRIVFMISFRLFISNEMQWDAGNSGKYQAGDIGWLAQNIRKEIGTNSKQPGLLVFSDN